MSKDKGRKTKGLERNLLTTENVLPMFYPKSKTPVLTGVSEHSCGPDGTRTRDLRRDRAAF